MQERMSLPPTPELQGACGHARLSSRQAGGCDPPALLEGTLAWLKENGLCCYPDLCLKPGSTTDHTTCVTMGKCPFLQL